MQHARAYYGSVLTLNQCYKSVYNTPIQLLKIIINIYIKFYMDSYS